MRWVFASIQTQEKSFDIHDIKICLQVRSPRLRWLKTQKSLKRMMWSERHLLPERVELELLPGKMWQQRWLWVVILWTYRVSSVSFWISILRPSFWLWSSKMQRTDDVQQTVIRYTCLEKNAVNTTYRSIAQGFLFRKIFRGANTDKALVVIQDLSFT